MSRADPEPTAQLLYSTTCNCMEYYIVTIAALLVLDPHDSYDDQIAISSTFLSCSVLLKLPCQHGSIWGKTGKFEKNAITIFNVTHYITLNRLSRETWTLYVIRETLLYLPSKLILQVHCSNFFAQH